MKPKYLGVAGLVAAVAGIFSLSADACQYDPSLRCSSTGNQLEIGNAETLSAARDLTKFLGVHALFWGVQSDLYLNQEARVSAAAKEILQSSGVGFIRYGGGVNEIDWRGCTGWVMERPKQKLVDWAPPMRCMFGIQEYEKLNDDLQLGSSWHIANVVGFEGQVAPIARMASDAAERATLVKKLASQRPRFWELGNELERGWPKWPTESIVKHSVPVAEALSRTDPEATLILPLLEYRPDWIANDDDHNRQLIRAHKPLVQDYALHMYYDNAPWGPSVANRLSYTRKVIALAKQEGVANPKVWITEHARPPQGTPANPNWKAGWKQTGDHNAVVATADFLIGLTQIQAAKGAAWHGLRAGPWNYIEVERGVLQHSRISRLFEMLQPAPGALSLDVLTTSVMNGFISTDYAVRGTAYTSADKSKTVVWLVNRSQQSQQVTIKNKTYAPGQKYVYKKQVMDESYSPLIPTAQLPTSTSSIAPPANSFVAEIPKRSVATLVIEKDPKP